MNTKRHDRFDEILRDLASRYLAMESNRTSLITVTRIKSDEKGSRVTIYITVFPDNYEAAALDFAKRKRSDFRDYVKENARLMRIPHIEFEIDEAEKVRRKIDGAPDQP